jgi:DNA-binding MarR family transcriptional regulator
VTTVLLALRRSTRTVQELLIVKARASGLSLPEFLTLARAADGDGVTVTDARRALGLGSSSMTALADRLQRDGLVRRVGDPTDRRLTVLKASAKGSRVVERALGPLYVGLGAIVGALEPEELRFLERFLEQTAKLYADQVYETGPPDPAARRASSARRPRRSGD